MGLLGKSVWNGCPSNINDNNKYSCYFCKQEFRDETVYNFNYMQEIQTQKNIKIVKIT